MACFEGPSAYEIVANGRKLVGCAQRRTNRAFLQHGSIPFSIQWQTLSCLFRDGTLPPIPKAIGLRECLGQGIEEHEVIEALLKSFSEALGVVCELGTLTEEEQELINCYKKAGLQLTFQGI